MNSKMVRTLSSDAPVSISSPSDIWCDRNSLALHFYRLAWGMARRPNAVAYWPAPASASELICLDQRTRPTDGQHAALVQVVASQPHADPVSILRECRAHLLWNMSGLGEFSGCLAGAVWSVPWLFPFACEWPHWIGCTQCWDAVHSASKWHLRTLLCNLQSQICGLGYVGKLCGEAVGTCINRTG